MSYANSLSRSKRYDCSVDMSDIRKCFDDNGEIYFSFEDICDLFGISNGIDLDEIAGADQQFVLVTDDDESIYLTFSGMMYVLYACNSIEADKFLSQASRILYTVKMGTAAQKSELVSEIVSASPTMVKKWCKITAGDTPCIYLFFLGDVRKLRESMEIPARYKNADCVYKLGKTGNLNNRTTQHVATFKKIDGVKLDLVCHAYIDPRYVNDAETMIKDTAADMDAYLPYQNSTELVVLSKKQLTRFKKQYLRAFSLYRGCVGELMDQVREQKRDLQDRDHDIALLKSQHEIELMKVRHENEILRMRLRDEQ